MVDVQKSLVWWHRCHRPFLSSCSPGAAQPAGSVRRAATKHQDTAAGRRKFHRAMPWRCPKSVGSCGNMYIITSLILITIITDVLLEREDLLFDSFGAYSFVRMPLTVNFLSQMKPPRRGSIFCWPQLRSLGRSTTGSVSIPKITLR